ncbi:hypothetical protein EFBL_3226 [Effusibacillus lacus]|uniref:PilZ domain-containing protein n=1 Tax=Effusibacillus lacus TaxID=1348429 RepID=A0A292YQS4_9BACL|nr:hypothetical protein EDD64_13367 [Effusibacillus lacus]GAX91536.1 hypothetical protein EFBL_3226 [Effusibacillus lacus]
MIGKIKGWIQPQFRFHNVERLEFAKVPESLTIGVLTVDTASKKFYTTWCKTLYISADRLSVLYHKGLSVRIGDLVGLNFQIRLDGRYLDIVTKGRIWRMESWENGCPGKVYSLKFQELKETDRMNLIQYVSAYEFRRRKLALYGCEGS